MIMKVPKRATHLGHPAIFILLIETMQRKRIKIKDMDIYITRLAAAFIWNPIRSKNIDPEIWLFSCLSLFVVHMYLCSYLIAKALMQ